MLLPFQGVWSEYYLLPFQGVYLRVSQLHQQGVELVFILQEHFSWLAALCGSHDACCFKLVHQSAGTVVADAESSLNHTGAALLRENDGMGCLLEVWVQVAGIHAAVASYAAILAGWFRQLHRFDRTRLIADVFVDALNLRCIYEGTLYTHWLVAVQVEHVTTTYQLVGTGSVKDGLGVDGRCHLEGDTSREVGLDVTGDQQPSLQPQKSRL